MIPCEKIIGYNDRKKGVKCMVCNYYYFKDKSDYQLYVYNDFHNFSMTVIDLTDIFVLKIKNVGYRVCISNIDKKETISIFKTSNLGDKGVL